MVESTETLWFSIGDEFDLWSSQYQLMILSEAYLEQTLDFHHELFYSLYMFYYFSTKNSIENA